MDFGDTCPKHQNVKHPERRLICVNELRNGLALILTHTHPPGDFLLFAAPQKSLLFVRGGMCVLFCVCFSSLGDPGETSALQPTLIFPDRVYEWLKIGGVVSTTSVFRRYLWDTVSANCFEFIQCHLCYYITTSASVIKVVKVGSWVPLFIPEEF